VTAQICDIKGPHDLEALEHCEDLLVYIEPFAHRLPSEIAAMGIEPPLARTVPLAFVPKQKTHTLRRRLEVTRWFARMNRGSPWPSSM
jgi:hypothetical protein